MIPHERSLVKKFEGRPFALLGVNADQTATEDGLKSFKKKAKAMGVTWRSFRDEGVQPSISDTWKIDGWPTLYYIDHKGVIQHKDIRGEEKIEKVLEAMIKAAEKDNAGEAKSVRPPQEKLDKAP